MTAQPFALDFQPGIQRDGTRFDANRYLDSLWCRFRLGRPRKMGGYQLVFDSLSALPRRLHCFYSGNQIIIHVGTSTGIQQVILDNFGNFVSSADRTPAGFPAGFATGFTFDAIFDTTSNVVQLVCSAVSNQQNLPDTTKFVPFLGQVDSSAPLMQWPTTFNPSSGVYTQPTLAGGICCVQPFVFGYCTGGFVSWSAPNLALYLGVVGGTSGAGEARISAQKIVAASALRGGGAQAPAAIFWSLSEVIVASYIGGLPVFAFTTVSPSSSILSSAAVIEYDGLYFWAGVDRFMVYNGTVNEVTNAQNQDWFFDNLTPGYESATFAFKVPRYGEIWWCAPMFGATVPSHAIIFNVRENVWYDTELPDGGRSAGYFAQGFKYPIMTAAVSDGDGYDMWIHEIGVDRVEGGQYSAIRSYFETPYFGGPKDSPLSDSAISFHQFEPDLQQSGDLAITLLGAANSRAPEITGPSVMLPLVPGVPQEQFASFTPRQPLRLSRLHIESNAVGGNYVCGRNIGHGESAEGRLIS